MPTMPSKNVRLVAIASLFTVLVFMADYEVGSTLDFAVGAIVASVTIAITIALLSLMDW